MRVAKLQKYRHISTSVTHFVEKKDVSGAFPDKYTPSIEEGWYQWWKHSGYFKPNPSTSACGGDVIPKKKFSIVLPPPNVTGVLHLGHALTTTIQDCLVRYHRMRGCETVWIPGSDHAGIATQVVVERQLMASQGITRHQLGRDKFQEVVAKWKEEKGDTILSQLEVLGASLDWDRTQFTLSPELNKSVNAAFIQLFNKGLIYRGNYLVNWSCQLQSAISDIEVEHVPLEKRTEFNVPGYDHPVEFGVMTDIAYKVLDSEDEIVVSTTRPETMLGDTAVAVHPEDKRYARFHGAKLWHPFREEAIPVILDEYVDPNLGTGAVKITPAHDSNDFEIGERHGLPSFTMLDQRGFVPDYCGEFGGMHRFAAREAVVNKLKIINLYRGEKDHAMQVPVCGRTGDVVEPLVKPQWFLKTEQIADLAAKAVREGDLKLNPEMHKAVWENWLVGERRKDWCISRQLWWGHQVPAWRCSIGGNEEPVWVAAHDESEARKLGAEKLECSEGEVMLSRDEDVLDTWFSSGIYPFAVHGWPDTKEDLDRYYPLSLMETGHDILFFWVARMVMLGIALTGKLPFHEATLHGIICDSQGRKMSKSLGNVIDPMHVIRGVSLEKLQEELKSSFDNGYIDEDEHVIASTNVSEQFPEGIPAFGTDALRWGLSSYDIKSMHINLDMTVIKTSNHWCNKIWQLARFLNMCHQRSAEAELKNLPKDFNPSIMDLWILNQLADTVTSVNQHMENHNLHLVIRDIRAFLYHDVCDVYVEYAKQFLFDVESEEFVSSLLFLHSCFMTSLRLIHPIMPFLTEELYQRLPKLPNERRKESIVIEGYPQAMEWNAFKNEDLPKMMNIILEVISGIRALKQHYDMSAKDTPNVVIFCESELYTNEHLAQFEIAVQTLSKCGDVNFSDTQIDEQSLPLGFVVTNANGNTIYMDIGKHVDVDKELEKLSKKFMKAEKEIVKVSKFNKGKRAWPKEQIEAKTQELEMEKVKLKDQMEQVEKLRHL